MTTPHGVRWPEWTLDMNRLTCRATYAPHNMGILSETAGAENHCAQHCSSVRFLFKNESSGSRPENEYNCTPP